MVREERRQMPGHADRSHARPPSAMRNAKGLVQTQMADIRADHRRRGQPHLRVQIGAIHMHLPTPLVDHLADVADRCLENAMGEG